MTKKIFTTCDVCCKEIIEEYKVRKDAAIKSKYVSLIDSGESFSLNVTNDFCSEYCFHDYLYKALSNEYEKFGKFLEELKAKTEKI